MDKFLITVGILMIFVSISLVLIKNNSEITACNA